MPAMTTWEGPSQSTVLSAQLFGMEVHIPHIRSNVYPASPAFIDETVPAAGAIRKYRVCKPEFT